MTPIAWDFLMFIKEGSMPIGVEIMKMNKPKRPVKRYTITASPIRTPVQSLCSQFFGAYDGHYSLSILWKSMKTGQKGVWQRKRA